MTESILHKFSTSYAIFKLAWSDAYARATFPYRQLLSVPKLTLQYPRPINLVTQFSLITSTYHTYPAYSCIKLKILAYNYISAHTLTHTYVPSHTLTNPPYYCIIFRCSSTFNDPYLLALTHHTPIYQGISLHSVAYHWRTLHRLAYPYIRFHTAAYPCIPVHTIAYLSLH